MYICEDKIRIGFAGEVISEEYALEYGTDKIEMHLGAVGPGDKVLLVDDLVATGGTLGAGIRLVGEPTPVACLPAICLSSACCFGLHVSSVYWYMFFRLHDFFVCMAFEVKVEFCLRCSPLVPHKWGTVFASTQVVWLQNRPRVCFLLQHLPQPQA